MNTLGAASGPKNRELGDTGNNPSPVRRRLGALALATGLALMPAASCDKGSADKPKYVGPTFVQDPKAHCTLTARRTGGLTYSFHIDARTAAGPHGSTIGPRTEVIFVADRKHPSYFGNEHLNRKTPHHAVSDFPYAYLNDQAGDRITAVAKIADVTHPAPPTDELPGMQCSTSFVIGQG